MAGKKRPGEMLSAISGDSFHRPSEGWREGGESESKSVGVCVPRSSEPNNLRSERCPEMGEQWCRWMWCRGL